MKYAKIINNIVVQIQPSQEDGFIGVADDAVCGMTYNTDGTLSITPKTAEVLALELKQENLRVLEATDKGMIRIAEDLLDLLVSKGIITEQELPQVAQDNLASRRNARTNL